MIEVFSNLFVGNEYDYYPIAGAEGWSVVHACKEPFHREALGYTTAGAPKDNPEYYSALRGNRLCLNLIDGADPKWVPEIVINTALAFIKERLVAGDKVLVHCNQGQSRSPSIALLFMHEQNALPRDFEGAVEGFKKLYPAYSPAGGMLGVIKARLNS